MTSFDYVVLGFAESDIVVRSIPFAIVVLSDRDGSTVLDGYVLDGWTQFNTIGPADIDHIAGFLEDFQVFSSEASGSDIEPFWQQLKNLDIGPIRTVSQGQCTDESTTHKGKRSVGVREIDSGSFSAFMLKLRNS